MRQEKKKQKKWLSLRRTYPNKKNDSESIRSVKKFLRLSDYSEEVDEETLKDKIEPEDYKSYSDASYLNVKEIKDVEWVEKVEMTAH